MTLLSEVRDGPGSLSYQMRTRRFHAFEQATARLPRPLRVLDVGGTSEFWEQRGWADREDVHIDVLNLEDGLGAQRFENVCPVVGDARDLPYEDGAFPVVFSNSVIEHLVTDGSQRRMAEEVRRVGVHYWVQTPNFWFPMEPHFLMPGWQWLPVGARVSVLQHHRVGQRGPCPQRAEAERMVREIRLLTGTRLRALFPGSRLVPERLGGLVKSWTAVGAL